jgi:sec-independent protein translocase protein TatC
MAALAKVYIPPPEEPESHDGAMSFLDHLEELRKRLVRACWAIGAGIIVAFTFVDRLADFVLAPARRALPPGVAIIYTHPGEGFGFNIEVAMLAGFIIAAPFVVYQLWLFIAPALYAHEKKLVIPFVLLGSAGIVGGAAFGHYVMFPSMMTFFASYHTASLRFMPQLDDVFRMYTLIVMGMSVVFQIPTVVFFAARMRVVTARFLWRHIKYAILLIVILAAVMTPSTDPWNLFVFAAPMIGLYVLSIAIAWAAAPRDRAGA